MGPYFPAPDQPPHPGEIEQSDPQPVPHSVIRGAAPALAIDHRDSLRAFLAPDAPGSVEPAAMTRIKADLARALLPLGATGVAQCCELVWQLRGQADKRQVPNAKVALQHNLGLGGACVVTLYEAR